MSAPPSGNSQAPGQISISGDRLGTGSASAGWDAEQGGGSITPADADRVELVSGPHLRAAIAGVAFVVWLIVRLWGGHGQLYILPAIVLCTASTSALWCTPTELAVSLGPVPVCFFRRRIAYEEVGNVTVVRGQLRQIATVAWQAITRPWQPHGFMYGLTMGKDMIDVTLVQRPDAPPKSRLWPTRLLISVDEADAVVDHVAFRKQYGNSKKVVLLADKRDPIVSGPVRWVLCDACDILLQPWRTMEPMALFSDGRRHHRTA